MLAVEQAVSVVHARDVDDLPCLVQLCDGDLGQSDLSDLALRLEFAQRTELIRQEHLRIDAVQLEQSDPLDAQPPQGVVDLTAQHLRAGAEFPPG